MLSTVTDGLQNINSLHSTIKKLDFDFLSLMEIQ
jgi:hypothetical protein